ncbi:PliI family lysozyme inhibitor of I-type lysozyme [Paraburkholderia sp. 40]|uniref:PliI family lysozyme inhibitor of I-type lysozyme n=1 Tax=Paraburkholderia sp. 40 TaxID=2991059 RepID=UPI003D1B736F
MLHAQNRGEFRPPTVIDQMKAVNWRLSPASPSIRIQVQRIPSAARPCRQNSGLTQLICTTNLMAASGNFLEVDALRIGLHTVRLLARVDTDTRHDVVATLRAA